MTQKGKVISVEKGMAVVSVKRSSMCDGCEKSGGCSETCSAGQLLGANKTMTATAINEIGAVVGDTVELEASGGTVLGYAALVFLFPIFLCAIAYFVLSALDVVTLGVGLGALGGFVAAFLLLLVIDRRKKKRGVTDIRITRIL